MKFLNFFIFVLYNFNNMRIGKELLHKNIHQNHAHSMLMVLVDVSVYSVLKQIIIDSDFPNQSSNSFFMLLRLIRIVDVL